MCDVGKTATHEGPMLLLPPSFKTEQKEKQTDEWQRRVKTPADEGKGARGVKTTFFPSIEQRKKPHLRICFTGEFNFSH